MNSARSLACRAWAAFSAWRWAERDREGGASLVEYALLVGLIALVCLIAVTYLGQSTCERLSEVPEQAFSSPNPTSC
jgi:Flp pilus assembly pilin Flp